MFAILFNLIEMPLSANQSCNQFDYNGDGSSNIGLFRPNNGLWKIRQISQFYFGRDGDIPLVGRFNNSIKAIYFNPSHGTSLLGTGPDWILNYHSFVIKSQVNNDLAELITKTDINCVQIQLSPFQTARDDLLEHAQFPTITGGPPYDNYPISDWADFQALTNIIDFLNIAHESKIQVGIELMNHMWVSDEVQATLPGQTGIWISNPTYWSTPDEDPWTEAAYWYYTIIDYIEHNLALNDKNTIAYWGMSGNPRFGTAEPTIWDIPSHPDYVDSIETYFKYCWPIFCQAGDRPKCSPTMQQIHQASVDWAPYTRLSGFHNLVNWIHEANLPVPDLYAFTGHPGCDPATDNYFYLRDITAILNKYSSEWGPQTGKMLYTDFGLGFYPDTINQTISLPLQWGFDKMREYGINHWWVWAYRDGYDWQTEDISEYGIRVTTGTQWREDRVQSITTQTRGCDIGIYRPSPGLWAIRGLTKIYFGNSQNPLPADYTGDGISDYATFNPANSRWSIRGVTQFYFGNATDCLVPGDYAGNGTCSPAVFRAANGLWAIRGLTRIYYGQENDIPVPGDYNKDGTWKPAIFRPTTNLWTVRGITRVYFGQADDSLIPGNYSGSGADTIGIFRDSIGLWNIRNITMVYFGTSGDIPVSR